MEKTEEADELEDFLVNFKFPWEEKSVHKPVLTVSRRHTLSDTTPARRTQRISGKVLLDEFCDVSPNEDETNPNANPSKVPLVDDVLRARVPRVPGNVSESEEVEESALLQRETNSLSLKKQKRRKRQSSLLKRRESIALLKTIGEIASPDTSGQVQQPSPGTGKPTFGDSPSSSNISNVKPVIRTKVRNSRRRSSRLSGMMAPLLELGENGMPKLVHLEEQIPMRNSIEKPTESVEQSRHVPLRRDSSFTVESVDVDVFETLSPRLHSGASSSSRGTLKTAESADKSFECRQETHSPTTPSWGLTDGFFEAGQYTTPRAADHQPSSYTPDKGMLCSLDSLQLQSEFFTPLQGKTDKTESSEREFQFSVSAASQMEEDSAPKTETVLPRCPQFDETSEETQMAQSSTALRGDSCEESSNFESKSEVELDKENIRNDSPSAEGSEVEEIDDKVKDLYLKRGQTAAKKVRNTNLETVFEELRPEEAGTSKRKYKRSLAFPEKPWEARKGTKARKKTKKKRLSLSKVANKQDSLLQERLTNILKDLAEEL